jgi:hypothetical protein
MTSIFFGQKASSSCCKSKETAQLDASELSATSSNEGGSCCSISSAQDSICSSSSKEDAIRNKAYLLWEEAGRPECDGTEFWIEAEKQLTTI